MGRIVLVVITLLCFTGCATLQPLNQTPPETTEQPTPAPPGEAPAGASTVWIVLGVLVAVAAIVVLADDDGGGGGGSGY